MFQEKDSGFPLSKSDMIFAFVIWVFAFSLYVRTLAPSLLWYDSAEFQTLSYTLGMTHTTGYMTYIIISHLFTKIPVGDIAYRVNMVSAFFGALAAAQVFLVIRALGYRRAAGLAASAVLVFFEKFWQLSLIAELYVPAAGFILSIWLLVILWNRTGNWLYLFAAGVLGGLSIGVHSTILVTAAAVLAYMLVCARKKSAWAAALAGALLGAALTLAAFLYLDANDPPSSVYNTVYRSSLREMGVTPQQFDTPLERLIVTISPGKAGSYYFSVSADVMYARLVEYIEFYPLWAAVLLPVGMIALFFGKRWYDGLYPFIGFGVTWGFAIGVAFASYQDFYVPPAGFAAVWVGVGVSLALDGIENLTARVFPSQRSLHAAIMTFISVFAVALSGWHVRGDLAMAVQKGYTSFIIENRVYPVFAPDKAIREARSILRHIDNNAIVFSNWHRLYSLIYTAELVEKRHDVTFFEADTIELGILEDSSIKYIEENIDSRPIYFTFTFDHLLDLYRLEQIGPSLYRVYRK